MMSVNFVREKILSQIYSNYYLLNLLLAAYVMSCIDKRHNYYSNNACVLYLEK
jgi:hypothetical protein